MKFDFIPGNPAFNISEIGNIAGTGGNTTLYRKAVRHAFTFLKDNGILLNITLKGIIPDLTSKHFKEFQVHAIHLMDDLDAWKFNTCYFYLQNSARTTNANIVGGLASKLYSPYPNECFPFVYYSGSNNGMDKLFGGRNRVIRQLPGRGRDTVAYDYTDKIIDAGPKFAFTVMESTKSYTVTDEPIYGGTICYVPFSTIEEAEKLMLFIKNNAVYKEYVKRMKLRGHAFGLRNLRRFDINQIVTGNEIPIEWGVTDNDLLPPSVFINEITNDNDRQKALGEVFTPAALVKISLDGLTRITTDAFSNPNYTFCDTMCGDGQFLIEVLNKKIAAGIKVEQALKTIFGVELMQDNVLLCRSRLLDIAGDNEETRKIINQNIVCHDTFSYDYNFDIKT